VPGGPRTPVTRPRGSSAGRCAPATTRSPLESMKSSERRSSRIHRPCRSRDITASSSSGALAMSSSPRGVTRTRSGCSSISIENGSTASTGRQSTRSRIVTGQAGNGVSMPETTARELKLVQYLNEAYGKEKQLETALQAQIKLMQRPAVKKRLQEHLKETKAQARGLER